MKAGGPAKAVHTNTAMGTKDWGWCASLGRLHVAADPLFDIHTEFAHAFA